MTLKIAACIKQVPDVTEVKIDPETNTLIREGVDAITNPLDLYAVEEAIAITRNNDAESCAMCMGPEQALDSVREAMAMGIDKGVLISDRAFAGSDTWATSFILARAVKKLGADLVICGKQATDGDTAQVGPGIAAHLNWAQACYVSKVLNITQEEVTVERLLDYGREVITLKLPAVITVIKELNNPRLTRFFKLLESFEKPVEKWGAAELEIDANNCGLSGSPTKVNRIFAPPSRNKATLIKGENAREKAQNIADIIAGI